MFSYRDMFRHGRICCNGVRWKQSTQNFELHLFSGTAKRRRKLLNETWKPGKHVHFMLSERGKTRQIDAPHITDRQIHKTLCRNALMPLYQPGMIYDNGASQPGKGMHFHVRRMKAHLQDHYRRFGQRGTIVLLDFHHFFPSAPHALLYARHRAIIQNDAVRAIADKIIAATPGGVGMPLGVEPSQVEMVALPSALDNYIKCGLRIHGAGHYMDDYYMIVPPHMQAEQVMEDVCRRAEAMGLTINRSKCQIVPLTKPFTFCKAKYRLTEAGAVKVRGSRDGMKRARRKLNAFRPKVESGEMAIKDVDNCLQSQIAYYEFYDNHGRVLRLRRIYHAIYHTINGGNQHG